MTEQKRKILLYLGGLVVAFALLGGCQEPSAPTCPDGDECIIITTTPEPTDAISASPDVGGETNTPDSIVVTNTPAPTATDIPTATLTGNETPTPIHPSPTPSGDNILVNGEFSEPFALDNGGQYGINEIIVANGWRAFYADEPHTPEQVPVPFQGTKNPAGLMMIRPEFSPTFASEHPERVLSGGTSQRWFCSFGACDGGVFQTINTVIGEEYEAGASFQLWAESGKHPVDNFGNEHDSHTYGYQRDDTSGICFISGFPGTSDTCSEDDRDNARAYILVNLLGDTFAFAESNLPAEREYYGYDEGCYDDWCLVTFRFTANSTSTTVFFGSIRNFPFLYNDTYLEDAYVRPVSP